MTRNIAHAGRDWLRCTGLSSRLPGTDQVVAFHDLDAFDRIESAQDALLQSYSNVLTIGTRKGAHLVTFDLVAPEDALRSHYLLRDLGQDWQHTYNLERYDRSILRVTPKYPEGMDLTNQGLRRNRANARPWSGPHWDFYNSLLGPIPLPGPLDLRVEGTGDLILDVYYTPNPERHP